MKFLLIEKPTNIIHLGPMNYSKNMFKYSLEEDLEITDFELPISLTDRLVISEKAEIVPCEVTEPSYNTKIERLNGPYWDYSNPDLAQGSYLVEPKPLLDVQGKLKEVVANNRWKKEIAGIKVTIQENELSISTTRGDRDIYLQALQLGADNKIWKFPEGFFTLSLADLQVIVYAIVNHVQTVFDWEAQTVNEIMSTSDLQLLDKMDLGEEKINNPLLEV